jgi:phosphohistidine phosphatase SixA
MKLYLVRHGAYRSEYTSERGPGLSVRGEEQARVAGDFLRAQGAKPEVLITSGYLRAQETATHILTQLNIALDPIETLDFSPSGDPATMRAIVEALDAKEVLVVGHMTSIGEFAHSLNFQAPPYFDTCTVMAFEYDGARWKFLWFNDCGRSVL